jgi:hypothetical protein
MLFPSPVAFGGQATYRIERQRHRQRQNKGWKTQRGAKRGDVGK